MTELLLLKQTYDLLVSEEKRLQKLITEFTSEITKKYTSFVQTQNVAPNQNVAQNQKVAPNRKQFLTVKTLIDDAFNKLNRICDYLSGPGTDQLIDQVVHTTVALASADSDQIRDLLRRIQVVEKAMSGYSRDNDNVLQLQGDMDKKLKSVTDLLRTSTEKNEAHMKEVDKRTDQLAVSITKEKDALVKRIAALEVETREFAKKLKLENGERDEKVKYLQVESTQLIEAYNGAMLYIGGINESINAIDKKIEVQQMVLDELGMKCNSSTQSIGELNESITKVSGRVHRDGEVLKAVVMDLKQQTTKTDSISVYVQKMNERQNTLSGEVNCLKVRQGDVNKQLTKDGQEIEKIKEECSEIKSQIAVMATQFEAGLRGEFTVGFTATPPGVSSVHVTVDSVVKKFTSVTGNSAGHYSPATGVFTAPEPGLYVASLTLCTLNEGRINVNVSHKPGNEGRGARKVTRVCRVSAKAEDNSQTGVGVVRMEAGDTLYMMPSVVSGDAVLSCYSSFSCFLLS